MEKLNIQYFVDVEKRTVVAKLTGVRENALNTISAMINKTLPNRSGSLSSDAMCFGMNRWDWDGNPRLLLEDAYYGKAKCAPEDEFSETVGKELARRRVIKQFLKAKSLAITNWMEVAEHRMNKLRWLEQSLWERALKDEFEI